MVSLEVRRTAGQLAQRYGEDALGRPDGLAEVLGVKVRSSPIQHGLLAHLSGPGPDGWWTASVSDAAGRLDSWWDELSDAAPQWRWRIRLLHELGHALVRSGRAAAFAGDLEEMFCDRFAEHCLALSMSSGPCDPSDFFTACDRNAVPPPVAATRAMADGAADAVVVFRTREGRPETLLRAGLVRANQWHAIRAGVHREGFTVSFVADALYTAIVGGTAESRNDAGRDSASSVGPCAAVG